MDLVKIADRIINLGPKGGSKNGGNLVASGSPEEIIEQEKVYTWKYLQQVI